ncbi:unnamed protein product [Fructobacillus cardui]|nr:unnamed protein product [Fructobacillus cardui]
MITLFINLTIDRKLNWSLVPLASSILVVTFIQTFCRVQRSPLLKATLLSYLPMLVLFFAIKLNTASMDFYNTIEAVSLWYLYYLFVVYLIEISNIRFYTCLWIFAFLSFPMAFFTRMILHSNFTFIDMMIKIALILVVTLLAILNIKGDYLNNMLNKYRLLASNK